MNSSSIKDLCEQVKSLNSRRLFSNKQNLSIGFYSYNISRKKLLKRNLVLMYVIQGQGTFQVEGQTTQTLKPGSLLIRKPEVLHNVTRNPKLDWCEFFIVFPDSFYKFLKTNNFLPNLNECLFIDLDLIWLKQLIEVTKKLEDFAPNEDFEASNLIFKLFADIKTKLNPKTNTPAFQQDMLDICKLIDQNPSLRLTNKELADKAGYGLENFRKIFKEVAGCSPQEYIIRQRIREAQKMLWENKLQLQTIAYELGYADLPSFSRQFKKTTGLSPSQYSLSSF